MFILRQSVSQSVGRSVGRSVSQLVSQSVSQAARQPGSQSGSQSVSKEIDGKLVSVPEFFVQFHNYWQRNFAFIFEQIHKTYCEIHSVESKCNM